MKGLFISQEKFDQLFEQTVSMMTKEVLPSEIYKFLKFQKMVGTKALLSIWDAAYRRHQLNKVLSGGRQNENLKNGTKI